MASLLSGIFNDVQDLFKQQMELFKREVRSDLQKTLTASLMMVAGGVVIVVGTGLLCLMLVYLLHWAFGGRPGDGTLPLWACYGIVGLGFAAVGGVLVLLGRNKFRSFNPLPDETVAALKENLEWKTTPR